VNFSILSKFKVAGLGFRAMWKEEILLLFLFNVLGKLENTYKLLADHNFNCQHHPPTCEGIGLWWKKKLLLVSSIEMFNTNTKVLMFAFARVCQSIIMQHEAGNAMYTST
jgi:hypothetical protein